MSTTTNTVVRPMITEKTFETVFKLSNLPMGKVGFDTALNVLLKKITLGTKSYEMRTIGNVEIVGNEKEDVT